MRLFAVPGTCQAIQYTGHAAGLGVLDMVCELEDGGAWERILPAAPNGRQFHRSLARAA